MPRRRKSTSCPRRTRQAAEIPAAPRPAPVCAILAATLPAADALEAVRAPATIPVREAARAVVRTPVLEVVLVLATPPVEEAVKETVARAATWHVRMAAPVAAMAAAEIVVPVALVAVLAVAATVQHSAPVAVVATPVLEDALLPVRIVEHIGDFEELMYGTYHISGQNCRNGLFLYTQYGLMQIDDATKHLAGRLYDLPADAEGKFVLPLLRIYVDVPKSQCDRFQGMEQIHQSCCPLHGSGLWKRV